VIAFEISINGHHIRTIAVGEHGMLTADVTWFRMQTQGGAVQEDLRTWSRGLEGPGGESVKWPEAKLKVGDAVTIRIVEADSLGDSPSERMSREKLREWANRPSGDAGPPALS
jgi:hypothetical protein